MMPQQKTGYCDKCGRWDVLTAEWNEQHTQFAWTCGHCGDPVSQMDLLYASEHDPNELGGEA